MVDRWRRAFFMAGVALCLATVSAAQTALREPPTSPVLTIDSERLFEESQFGRQIVEELEALGAELAAENREIEADLGREEKNLTAVRPTMEPAEFRALADDFDARVQETRRTQDAKSRALNAKLDARRVAFLNAAAPVLERLMREAGATVVLELRATFISSNAVDITEIAIERLDAALEEKEISIGSDD